MVDTMINDTKRPVAEIEAELNSALVAEINAELARISDEGSRQPCSSGPRIRTRL
jgi:hypothetical protein